MFRLLFALVLVVDSLVLSRRGVSLIPGSWGVVFLRRLFKLRDLVGIEVILDALHCVGIKSIIEVFGRFDVGGGSGKLNMVAFEWVLDEKGVNTWCINGVP